MLRHTRIALLAPSILSVASCALFCADSAQAKPVDYIATLSGQSATIRTGSSARGTATISVDMAAKTVAIRLNITGMAIEALWDKLVKAPIGPIHLHQYANGNLADAGASELAFPLPYGKSYKPTAKGFRVTTGALPYAKAVAPLGQQASFETFVAALEKGTVVVNVHTDAFNEGEINGAVVKSGG